MFQAEPFSRCHQAANVPDSVTMIHLGKQKDKATRSPTVAMPIGEALLQGTNHPSCSHGARGWHRNWVQLYLEVRPATCLIRMCFALRMYFAFSLQGRGFPPLPVNQTGPQLPFSKIRLKRGRCDSPLLAVCADAPWQELPNPALTMLPQGMELKLPGTGSTGGMGGPEHSPARAGCSQGWRSHSSLIPSNTAL